MVYHKMARKLVVAVSLVALIVSSMPRAVLIADDNPVSPVAPPPNATTPAWDLSTVVVYESVDVDLVLSAGNDGSPVITAVVDPTAEFGTFAFSVVSLDGFESMHVMGEVLNDGTIMYETQHTDLAAATGTVEGAAAWAAADSEPGFWDDYWRYLWNPSDMDTDLEIGFYGAAGTAGVCLTAAGGCAVIGFNPVIAGGGAATTGGGLIGAGGGAAASGGGLVGGTVATTQRLAHIFANARHNLTALLNVFNQNQAAALAAVKNATITALTNAGITSGTFQITVVVSGMSITVRGIVENGVVRIGTFFM